MTAGARSGAIHIVRPGLQTTVQDAGRWGWQAMGVSVSGAMDRISYRAANALASNPAGLAALEVGFAGPEMTFDDARTIAIAGAEFDITMNGHPVATHSTIQVPPGGRLTFGARHSGARAYLAIAGGIDVPLVLRSRSTHLPGRLGGFKGRALTAGDTLQLGTDPGRHAGALAPSYVSPARMAAVLRVLPGRHVDWFVDAAMDALQAASYLVGIESNRMGFRLEGTRIEHRDTADIQSEITPMGSVQVPASGQPILLMADRQTTGGYTVVANVIAADLPIAGQLAPGDRGPFRMCSMEEAHSALVTLEQVIAGVERDVAP